MRYQIIANYVASIFYELHILNEILGLNETVKTEVYHKINATGVLMTHSKFFF